MLLIVLPSSGQRHPLGAWISTPGRGEALDRKPSRPEASLELCKNDLHISKETETWQGQTPAQTPPPQLCFGLRKGKISLLRLRGLDQSRMKPAQYQVLATQKASPNYHSWQALPENTLPSFSLLSHTRRSSSLDGSRNTQHVSKNGLEFKERPCNYRDNCYISEPNIT